MRGRLVHLPVLIVLILAALPIPVRAQAAEPERPVYVVQAGDSLWAIAQRFGVSMADLVAVNQLSEPVSLQPGDELLIPGLEGVSGRLETQEIGFGETLHSLSMRYHIPEDDLARLNRVSGPSELYAGINLIVVEPQENAQPLTQRTVLSAGESPLELAIRSGASPWQISAWNQLENAWLALPGEVLHLPGEDNGPGSLPPSIQAITMTLPLVQGQAAAISIQAATTMTLTGELDDYPLHFMRAENGQYVALQGIHAQTVPGLKTITLRGAMPDGSQFGFSQLAPVLSGGYVYDPDLTVPAETVDPAITGPENELWYRLFEPVTPIKYWSDLFVLPVAPEYADCYPSYFGNRRSYNNSGYLYFHTGQDFCSWNGDPIYAAAAGTVVYTGTLTVRGGVTVIDHGWGVYTAYMHQQEILVEPGQQVQAGEQIGLAGDTGRVSGPHLHFEVIAGGVQVDPLLWLERIYP
jgi:murein DD-endopeptidase MepM/ murein hydrolase activator NlpD